MSVAIDKLWAEIEYMGAMEDERVNDFSFKPQSVVSIDGTRHAVVKNETPHKFVNMWKITNGNTTFIANYMEMPF